MLNDLVEGVYSLLSFMKIISVVLRAYFCGGLECVCSGRISLESSISVDPETHLTLEVKVASC